MKPQSEAKPAPCECWGSICTCGSDRRKAIREYVERLEADAVVYQRVNAAKHLEIERLRDLLRRLVETKSDVSCGWLGRSRALFDEAADLLKGLEPTHPNMEKAQAILATGDFDGALDAIKRTTTEEPTP